MYKKYAQAINDQTKKLIDTTRINGIQKTQSNSGWEVEPVEDIFKRFATVQCHSVLSLMKHTLL